MAENAAESLQRGTRIVVMGRLEQRSWETQEGEKRSKIEVIADEIGPSLRWATAEVKKNDRRSPGEGGGPGGPGGEGGQGGQGAQGGGAGRQVRNEPPPGYDADEEPF